MKIKNILKITGALGLALMLGLTPIEVAAYGDSSYGWSLDGESSVTNKVEKADGTLLVPTTQVNFHVGCVTGVIVTTPFTEIAKMMELTDDEIYYGSRPVLYVGMATNGDVANKLIDDSIAAYGGTRIENMDIQLFEWTGSNYQSYTESSSPLTLVVGLTKKDRNNDRNYALLQLTSGGNISYYYDTDSDSATVTFNTSSFTGTYVLFSYPKDFVPADQTANGPVAQPGADKGAAAESEYDDVPKTGEARSPLVWILFTGGTVLLAAGLSLKRNQEVKK